MHENLKMVSKNYKKILLKKTDEFFGLSGFVLRNIKKISSSFLFGLPILI
jgi:hypothetical protein